MATLREHIRAESAHDMAGVLHGFTGKCFNDIACVPKPFVGRKQVAERYRKHWEGFPDFEGPGTRVSDRPYVRPVTENEWTGTHRGTFMGLRPTGKRLRVRALVVWHFKGDKLLGETVFFDMGSIQRQIGARVTTPRRRKRAGA